MDLLELRSFSDEMQKLALSGALLARYAAGRAAQGSGAARMLGKQLTRVPGATSRQIASGQAGRAAQHALGETAAAGRSVQRTQVARRAFAPQQARVTQAYQRAVASPTATRQMAGPKLVAAADQGATGMSGVARPYSPAHIERAVGGTQVPSPQLVRYDQQQAILRQQKQRATTIPALGGPHPGAQTQVGLVGGTPVRPASTPAQTAGTAVAKRRRPLATHATQTARPGSLDRTFVARSAA